MTEKECNHNFAISIVYLDKSIDDKVGTCLSFKCNSTVELSNYNVIPDNEVIKHYHNEAADKYIKSTHKVYERK